MKSKLTKRIEAAYRLQSTLSRLERQLEEAKEAEKRHLAKKRNVGPPSPKNVVEAILLSGVDGSFGSHIEMIERHIRATKNQLAHLDALNQNEKRHTTWKPT